MNKPFTTIPAVQRGLIGDIPDLHAKRIVADMLEFLNSASMVYARPAGGGDEPADRGQPQGAAALGGPDQRSDNACRRGLRHTFGKRAKFQMLLSIWTPDKWSGATVKIYLAFERRPGDRDPQVRDLCGGSRSTRWSVSSSARGRPTPCA